MAFISWPMAKPNQAVIEELERQRPAHIDPASGHISADPLRARPTFLVITD